MTDNTPEGMRAALASLFASKATYSGDEVIRRILDPALAAPVSRCQHGNPAYLCIVCEQERTNSTPDSLAALLHNAICPLPDQPHAFPPGLCDVGSARLCDAGVTTQAEALAAVRMLREAIQFLPEMVAEPNPEGWSLVRRKDVLALLPEPPATDR